MSLMPKKTAPTIMIIDDDPENLGVLPFSYLSSLERLIY